MLLIKFSFLWHFQVIDLLYIFLNTALWKRMINCFKVLINGFYKLELSPLKFIDITTFEQYKNIKLESSNIRRLSLQCQKLILILPVCRQLFRKKCHYMELGHILTPYPSQSDPPPWGKKTHIPPPATPITVWLLYLVWYFRAKWSKSRNWSKVNLF